MLENPNHSSIAATTVKRYAPPNQRNRVLNRRKSGARDEKTNSLYGNDGEKSQVASSRNIATTDHGETGSNNQNENPHLGFVVVDGCCSSVATQLLNDRWAAAMLAFNDTSIDLSERPVMYSGAAASAWGHSRTPHQMDFLGELQRKIRNAKSSTDA